ncbi:MAG: hypothetical protein Q8N18_06985 [Opitutaceae bacterium]|nr:hypothetical protein [Opitutaceae bacterium]
MRMPSLLLLFNTVALLALSGCATAHQSSAIKDAERAASTAAKARYWALQAEQKPTPVSSDFEFLPLARPERTEDGILRTPSMDFIRVPRLP